MKQSAITWLTNEAKLVHGNICASSIFISRAGDWKLGGVDLLYNHGECPDYYKTHHKTVVPTTYRSPELAAGNYDNGPAWATDSWALGCLLFQVPLTFNRWMLLSLMLLFTECAMHHRCLTVHLINLNN
jgi:serine/threonine protein kinase